MEVRSSLPHRGPRRSPTKYPQGVCRIRSAAKLLTAALWGSVGKGGVPQGDFLRAKGSERSFSPQRRKRSSRTLRRRGSCQRPKPLTEGCSGRGDDPSPGAGKFQASTGSLQAGDRCHWCARRKYSWGMAIRLPWQKIMIFHSPHGAAGQQSLPCAKGGVSAS